MRVSLMIVLLPLVLPTVHVQRHYLKHISTPSWGRLSEAVGAEGQIVTPKGLHCNNVHAGLARAAYLDVEQT